MSIFEYDKELEEKKLRKAEYEAGFSDGEKSGHETGFSEGRESGFPKDKTMLQLKLPEGCCNRTNLL